MATRRRRLKLKDISPQWAIDQMPEYLQELEMPDGFENAPPLPDQITVEYEDGYIVTVDTATDKIVDA